MQHVNGPNGSVSKKYENGSAPLSSELNKLDSPTVWEGSNILTGQNDEQ